MKKAKCLSIILLSLCAVFFSNLCFAARSSSLTCDCESVPCICFIQSGDEGNAVKQIIKLLVGKGYLTRNTPTGRFTAEVEAAIKKFQSDNKLTVTGMMDDDTLTLLLWGTLPSVSDTAMSVSSQTSAVYIPTDGGKKRHLNPLCSKMQDPRKVSDRNAEKLGFDRCKKCYK